MEEPEPTVRVPSPLVAPRRSVTRRLHALEAERVEIERELSAARVVQQLMLPRALPELLGAELAAGASYCQKLGGDYHDAFWLDEHRLAVVMADVSGHGIAAAMVMATARAAIRVHARYLDTPGRILAELSESLRADVPPGMFVTLWFGVLDTRDMGLAYASAGHPYPLRFLGASDAAPIALDRGGFPLGLRESATYPEDRVALEPGDLLLLYTDGVVEAKDARGARYGVERLAARCARPRAGAGALVQALFDDLGRHLGDAPPADDASVVALAVDPALARLVKDVASDDASVAQATGELLDFAASHGLATARHQAVLRLLLREAASNAVIHGNRCQSGRRVRFAARCDARRFRVTVADEGEGFDGKLALRRLLIDTRSMHGRGLFLMMRYADRVTYNDRGNELTFELLREPAAPFDPA